MGEIIFPGYTFFFASSRVHICQTSLAEIWFWPVNLDTYVEYHVDVSSEVSIRKGLHVLAIMRFVHYCGNHKVKVNIPQHINTWIYSMPLMLSLHRLAITKWRWMVFYHLAVLFMDYFQPTPTSLEIGIKGSVEFRWLFD